MIKRIFILGITAVVMLSSCGNRDNETQKQDNNNIIAETDLGLIKSDLMNDDEQLLGNMPEYSNAAPGTAQRIERAFENAPPMIPHMTTGFFPITKNNNICLSCHMPDKIEVSGAIAIPETHFTKYRPEVLKKNGIYAVDAKEGEVYSKKLKNLDPARFNCSQCHVPQANVTVDIKNNFERVFRNEKLKKTSNLKDNIEEGVN
jgi:cytochrome c-type protein NapB